MLPRSIVARLLLAIVAVLLLRGSPLISVVTAKKLSKLLPQLDSSTFDSFVGYKPLCLAVFTSKNCPKCPKLVKDLELAQKILGGHPSRNAISWVDGDKETGLVERFNVTGYPTLIQYELGEQEEYTGVPVLYANGPAIAAYVKLAGQVKRWPIKKSGNTESAIEQLSKQHNNTILGVFREPVTQSPMFEEFKIVALLLSLPGQSTDVDISYHSIRERKTSTEVSEMYVSKVPGVVVFKKYGFGDLEWDQGSKAFSATSYLTWLQKKAIISKEDLRKAFVPTAQWPR